ncbi:hypothetical protein [Streptomyces murinus]|uniref:hypothetical protein n=1 Tax=Streptomyces murinus TaxID=33900 RepID=UPI0037FB8FE9
MSVPTAGTTRYLCPLECGWHHDVPPPSAERIAALGVAADPAARDLAEAISSVAKRACLTEAEWTERALCEHLATHTTEQFVRTIQGLRAEVAQMRGAGSVRPDEELLSPGSYEVPPGAEGRFSPGFIDRINQRRPDEEPTT